MTHTKEITVLETKDGRADRYSVIIEDKVYNMSVNALMASGHNQFNCTLADFIPPFNAEVIPMTRVPEQVKQAIESRIK